MPDDRTLPSMPPAAREVEPTLRPAEITLDERPADPAETERLALKTRAAASGAEVPHPARRFGDYELMNEIARGGMGVVYRARQQKLNRVVALKMIRSAGLASEQDVERFQTEARAAANLQHPGIVAIYEVGESGGQHFYAMEYVDGQSLSQLIEEHPLDPISAARHVEQISRAIQYAHEQGVLHRDLKPSNVLVDRRGRVRVTDFGLAKRLTSDSHLTATGDVLGTPSYMPPEQALGDQTRIGPRSDVYSLGAVLYALVTGQPPFRAANSSATLLQVIENEPVSPRLVNPSLPVDLETICLKCLDKEPARRYASADALADDLSRFLGGEPVKARPVGRLERLARWCRRNPALAGALAACFVVLLAGTAVSTYFAIDATRQANDARREKSRADGQAQAARDAEKQAREQAELATAARERAESEKTRADDNAVLASERAETSRRNLYVARLNLAGQALAEGEIPKVVELLEAVRPQENETDLRGFEWRHYWEATHSSLARIGDSDNAIYPRRVCLSPDEKLLLGAESNAIKAFDLATRKLVLTLAHHTGTVNDFLILPGGELLVSASGHEGSKGQIRLWNWRERKQLAILHEGPDPVMCLAVSPDGQTLLAGTAQLGKGFTGPNQRFGAVVKGSDGAILVFDMAERKLAETLPLAGSGVVSLAFSPAGNQFALGGSDGVVRLYDWPGKKLERELAGHVANIWRVAYSNDGALLAVASGQFNTAGMAKLWDAKSGREQGPIMNHAGGVFDVAFSPVGRQLATAGWDKTVQLWNAAGSEPYWLGAITGHESHALCLAYSRDGQTLFSGGEALRVNQGSPLEKPDTIEYRVWNIPRQTQVYPMQFGEPVNIKGIVVPYFDRHASRPQLMDFNTGELQPQEKCSVCLATGRYARIAEDGKSVLLIDLLSGAERRLDFSHEGLKLVQFADGGKHLLGLGAEAAVVWQVESGQSVGKIPCGQTGRTRLSADGTLFATQGAEPNSPPRYWKIPSGKEEKKPSADLASWFAGPTGYRNKPFLYSWLSDNGRYRTLSTKEPHGWLTVINLERGWEHGFQACERWVRSVDVTADGKLMALCGYDFKTDLWNLETRERVARFDSGQAPCLALSPDGTLLATGGDDTVVRLWDLQTLKERATLRGHTEVIWHVTFSPDGRRVVSTAWDRTVKLWDVDSGQLLASFITPRLEVWQSYFSADGRLLLTFDKQTLTVRRAGE